MTDSMDVARRHDDAWNKKDEAGRRDCYTADVEVILPGGMQFRGPVQVLQMEHVFWDAIPDSQIQRDYEIDAGDTVVNEGVMTGTHTGPFLTPQGAIPASGNSINLRYATVKRIVDGKIASEHLYFDQVEFLTQIGAFPPPSPA
jgi:steroid delta-isomerase-like uncharacterized protein